MAKNIQESQQQGQGVTIGTQGNEDQPTPLGDDLHHRQKEGQEDRHIPNQDRSSATNQERASSGPEQNI
jgi:hypothetical protein